jgi:capsular polysaccharide biosynthesis protein
MHHYGHFLVETLPNLGWIRHIPAFDWLVFHRFHESKSSHPNLLKVLRFLNVPPEKVKIVEGPLSFEQITIPERLFAFHKSAHIRAKEMHSSLSQAWGAGNAAGNSPDPGWYYLSRVNTALTSGGAAVANEVFLEETLMRCGVDVVYPEQLDFETQVRLFSSAQVVIGPGGSAMHNILFSPPGGVLIELADTRSIGQFYPTQAICNRLAGWTGVFAPFMGQILSAQEGRGICWFKVGPLRKFILDTIAAHGLAGSAPKRGKRLGHTSRRDGLLLSAKCLLKTALRRATAGRSGLLRRGTFVR